jgi:hypothetical protein
VTLRFRAGADRDAIECCMFQIVVSFAVVEVFPKRKCRINFGSSRACHRQNTASPCRRRFSDLEYPQRFDAAFRRITGDFRPKVEILLKKKRRKPQRPRHDRVAAAVVAVEQNRLQTTRAVRPGFILDPHSTRSPSSDITWVTSTRRRP